MPVTAFPELKNNSCGDTIYRPVIQLDFDSIINNTVPDMLNPSGINDLMLGTSVDKTHPKSWSQYTHDPTTGLLGLGFDPNEPYVMKDRGILFKGNRYLTTITNGTVWMLIQPHWFTIEAWVRKDVDDFYDPKMG